MHIAYRDKYVHQGSQQKTITQPLLLNLVWLYKDRPFVFLSSSSFFSSGEGWFR